MSSNTSLSQAVPWVDVSPGITLMPTRYLRVGQTSGQRLDSVCDIASGCYAPRYISADAEAAAPYLRVDNIREFVPNLSPDDLVYVDPREFSSAERQRVTLRSGDVVISRTGTLGKAFLVPPQLDGAIMSQHLTRLRAAESADAFAIAAYLNSTAGKDAVNRYASGSTRPELTHEAVRQISIELPVISEALRRSVAMVGHLFGRMMSSAVEAIQTCQQIAPFADVESLGHSHVGRIPPPVDVTASWLPRYWNPHAVATEQILLERFICTPLGDLAEIRRGPGTSASDYARRGVPFIRTSSLINFSIDFFPDHYGAEETYNRYEPKPAFGDLLLSMEGKMGCVALVGQGERYLVKNHIEIIRLKPTKAVTPAFLFAFLTSPLGQAQIARRTIVQSTISGLGSASREILVPVEGRTIDAASDLSAARAKIDALVGEHLAARADLLETLSNLKKLSD